MVNINMNNPQGSIPQCPQKEMLPNDNVAIDLGKKEDGSINEKFLKVKMNVNILVLALFILLVFYIMVNTFIILGNF